MMTLKGRDRPGAILIAGPTASGKSALALDLAERFGGTVVNADSMQVYRGIEILSAQPDAADLARAPHSLYGHRDPSEPYSVGDWLREVAPLVSGLMGRGEMPIVCGGTGLYFRALLGGLDEARRVSPEIRRRWRERMAEEGAAALHGELWRRDPLAAARLPATDTQRITRALELTEAEQEPPDRPSLVLPDLSAAWRIVLAPERSRLRARIAERFRRMMERGAMEEAARFAERHGPAASLAGKAIGLEELIGAHRGDLTVESAVERAVTRSRQYAKRQETWFRHQFGPEWTRIAAPDELAEGEPADPSAG